MVMLSNNGPIKTVSILTPRTINPYIKALHVFWMVLPFLMAGIIFFFPAKRISKILSEYKLFEQWKIKRKLDYIRQLVIAKSDEGTAARDEIDALYNHYQKLQKIEEELHKMNSWPYNIRYRATFLSIFSCCTHWGHS